MKMLLGTIAAGLLIASAGSAQEKQEVKEKPVVEIAILLDTSGSMNGLIDQVRTRLWSIVNGLATTKKDGVRPDLRVALFEYGKSTVSAQDGHIRLIVPLSTDLDKISKELFALKTNGGNEYCGWVIQSAVDQLKWTKGDHYRAIFIAGNEPFTQGSVHYEVACKAAIAKGIIVNTIHCGPRQTGINGKWAHAATLADGQANNIDQNAKTVHIPAPQDKRIAELNKQINNTYIGYGRLGRERKKLQKDLDDKAEESSKGGLTQRAQAKASGYYKNSAWDLVDALKEKKVDLAKIKKEDLPKEMREMTLEQKKAYIKKKSVERKKVMDEMAKLSKERRAYVVQKRKELGEKGKSTFDTAMEKTLKEQLAKKGFQTDK